MADPLHSLAHRPEIDGLRAVAIVAVILFHAGFDMLPGGFLGVDVFFVISGFLITQLILRQQQDGSLRLADFFARRARRILPALFFVMAVCTVPAALLMSADQFRDYLAAMLSTTLFGSNFYLAATTGYFDGAAELRPLLHTWSLAVEEQFYLVFPLLLVACRRLPTRKLAMLLLALALASLLLTEYGWRHHRSINFYLAPGRCWELLAGALSALLLGAARPHAAWPGSALREALAAAGFVAVIASFVLFNRHTPAPSLYCLLPVLGTAAVLLFAGPATVVGRLLTLRAVTGLGLVSYSAYLWHQPLFAFARISSLDPPSLRLMWVLIAATLVLAVATWRFVERPVRSLTWLSARRTLQAALAAGGALVVASVAGMAVSDQAPRLVPASVSSAFKPVERAKECFDIPKAHAVPTGWSCEINPGAEPAPSFVLFGDSHALQLLGTFSAAARAAGRSGVFAGFSGCPPLPGTVPLTGIDQGTHDCRALNDRMYEWARTQHVKDMVLAAKWSYYTDASDAWSPGYINAIGLSADETPSVEGSRRAFHAGAARAAAWARGSGTRLHVIAQVPQQAYAPSAVYERAYGRPGAPESRLRELSVSSASHQALQAFPNGAWRAVADSRTVVFVSFDSLLCDAERCPVGSPTQSYYKDRSHLSADGAMRLVGPVTRLLMGSPDS